MKILLVVALCLAAMGCKAKRYPEDVRENFLSNCVANSGKVPVCECSLRGIEKKYEYSTFVLMEEDMRRGGEMPFGMRKIALDCSMER